jgi:hypothetical protein
MSLPGIVTRWSNPLGLPRFAADIQDGAAEVHDRPVDDVIELRRDAAGAKEGSS